MKQAKQGDDSMITAEFLAENGYQRTNNIHAYDGTVWTPKGQGILEPMNTYTDGIVLTGGGNIYIMRATLQGEPYVNAYYTHERIAYFITFRSFQSWLAFYGKESLPGLPAWSQGNLD